MQIMSVSLAIVCLLFIFVLVASDHVIDSPRTSESRSNISGRKYSREEENRHMEEENPPPFGEENPHLGAEEDLANNFNININFT